MPTSLQLTSLDAAYGARPLFQDLTLGVGPRDVVALVGPNGSGKSTLLRIVAGLHQAEGGSVDISPPGSTVGYLPQQAPLGGESLAAYARRRTGVTRAEQELEAATAALVEQRPGADDGYAAAMERWLGLGGADWTTGCPSWPPGSAWPSTWTVHWGACPAVRRPVPACSACWRAASTCCCSTSRPTTSTRPGWR